MAGADPRTGGLRRPAEPAANAGKPCSIQPACDFEPTASASKPSVRRSGEWLLADGWTLREAPKVEATGVQVSQPNFPADGWMRATVPGTVLTTLVDDGILSGSLLWAKQLSDSRNSEQAGLLVSQRLPTACFVVPRNRQPSCRADPSRNQLQGRSVAKWLATWIDNWSVRTRNIRRKFTVEDRRT